MIPRRYITEWIEHAPWQSNAQIEQDLILSRVIAEIYNHPILRDNLIFRGGTALNKLFLQPASRYSEDIDLVQLREGPIGALMEVLRETLDPWLGAPKWKQSHGRVTLYYKFESEIAPVRTMKVKVEINTREHGSDLDLLEVPFTVANGWYSADASVRSYQLEELMATKLRALYQRKKGRDLFDISQILEKYPSLDCKQVCRTFHRYLENDGLKISRAEFEQNLALKMEDPIFKEDIVPLLQPRLSWNIFNAYQETKSKLMAHIGSKYV